jgi:hypothetical protein
MKKQIKYNQLTLILPSGKSYTFGPGPSSIPRASKKFARRGAAQRQLVGRGTFDYPASSTSSVFGLGAPIKTPVTNTSTNVLDSGVETPLTSVDAGSPQAGEVKIVADLGVDLSQARFPAQTSISVSSETEAIDDDVDDDQLEHDVDDTEDPMTPVTIKILSSNFFLRLLLSGDLGFAESYMAGECQVRYTPRAQGGLALLGLGAEGQRLDTGYYEDEAKVGVDGQSLSGWREGEELLELFKVRLWIRCSSWPKRTEG